MFTRIMAVVMAAILLLTAVLTGLAVVTLRGRQIDTRLEELRKEAREIAYLASQSSGGSIGYLLGQDSSLQYLSWKASQVYEDFGSAIMVVDRSGRMMNNIRSAYE